MTQSENQQDTENLGSKIKRLRVERKLAQERLAIEAHVDQSGLSKFERGRDRNIGETSLRRIAGVLKISFEELVANTDYGKRQPPGESL